MTKKDNDILKNFLYEMIDLGYNYKDLRTCDIWKFRYVCYKFNYFIKNIDIPNIKKEVFMKQFL